MVTRCTWWSGAQAYRGERRRPTPAPTARNTTQVRQALGSSCSSADQASQQAHNAGTWPVRFRIVFSVHNEIACNLINGPIDYFDTGSEVA